MLRTVTFWHSNIIKYCSRPFANVEEMNEILIQNWNAMVKQHDTVFFLGDFAFKNVEQALAIRRRLNGIIHFIEGNHDYAAHKIRQTFAWFKPVAMVKVGDQEIFLSHYAHRVWPKSHYKCWMLFAHSHGTLPDDPNALSIDVGVDAVAARLAKVERTGAFGTFERKVDPKNYRPMSYEEVKAIMATKTFKPIDHHGD